VAGQRSVDAMTGDPEWRALYLEFLAHAARDMAFRRRFARRTQEMRSALEEVVVERTRPVAGALDMEPEQLAVVIDALGTGLWASTAPAPFRPTCSRRRSPCSSTASPPPAEAAVAGGTA
jgi:hypothetical protein